MTFFCSQRFTLTPYEIYQKNEWILHRNFKSRNNLPSRCKRSCLPISSVFLYIIVQVLWLIKLNHIVTKFHEEFGRISEFLQYCKTWSDEMLVEGRRDCCKLPSSVTVRCLFSWWTPTFRGYHDSSAFRIEFTLSRMQNVCPQHRYFPLLNFTTLHHRIPVAVTNTSLIKWYDQLNKKEHVELLRLLAGVSELSQQYISVGPCSSAVPVLTL
jgi:hypothetical protein